MELSEFKIREVVFEVRYDDAFILWDVAGKVHQDLSRLWPGVSIEKAEGNEQVLKSDSVQILTGIRLSRVALYGPSTVVKFSEQIAETLRIWVAAMNITKFKRVGTRVILQRKFPSADAANKAVVDMGLVRYPPPPFFNHKVPPHSVETRILWQDDTTQTQFIAKAQHTKIEFSTMDDPGTTEKRESDMVVIDIDRATKGTVDLSKLRVIDWMEAVRHLIYRDAQRLLRQS